MSLTEAPPTDTSAAVWERACHVDELEPAWGEALLLRMKQIALFLISPSEIYAVSHRDPATEAYVMARGIVGSKGEHDRAMALARETDGVTDVVDNMRMLQRVD